MCGACRVPMTTQVQYSDELSVETKIPHKHQDQNEEEIQPQKPKLKSSRQYPTCSFDILTRKNIGPFFEF